MYLQIVLNTIDYFSIKRKLENLCLLISKTTINLVNSVNNEGAPNLLLALGLCCYTEYWGKFLNGSEQTYKKTSRTSKTGIGYSTKCSRLF